MPFTRSEATEPINCDSSENILEDFTKPYLYQPLLPEAAKRGIFLLIFTEMHLLDRPDLGH